MSKNLIAFFSASGTTKKVAEMIAEEAKADLFEIEPKVPYTKADLDWMNKKSRSSVEMSDKKYRPEIMKKKMDMSSYDEILLGFPIWWYVAPTIVNTFLGDIIFYVISILILHTALLFLYYNSSTYLPNIVLFTGGYHTYQLDNGSVLFSKQKTLKNTIGDIRVKIISDYIYLEDEL